MQAVHHTHVDLSCKIAVLLCKAFVENIFCTIVSYCMLVYITVVLLVSMVLARLLYAVEKCQP